MIMLNLYSKGNRGLAVKCIPVVRSLAPVVVKIIPRICYSRVHDAENYQKII